MIDEATYARIGFLSDIRGRARRELMSGAVLRRLDAGVVLWTRGAQPRGLFVIVEGRVRVVRGSGGRQHVVHVEGPGGTLGEVPLFEGGTYPAAAIAAEPTTCVVFTRESIAAAIAADPEVAWVFLSRMATRVRHLVERLNRLAAQGVVARLAAHLLALSDAAGTPEFALGATHEQIAEELGTVREVVVRALRRLRNEGAIRSSAHGRIEILDEKALRGLARSH